MAKPKKQQKSEVEPVNETARTPNRKERRKGKQLEAVVAVADEAGGALALREPQGERVLEQDVVEDEAGAALALREPQGERVLEQDVVEDEAGAALDLREPQGERVLDQDVVEDASGSALALREPQGERVLEQDVVEGSRAQVGEQVESGSDVAAQAESAPSLREPQGERVVEPTVVEESPASVDAVVAAAVSEPVAPAAPVITPETAPMPATKRPRLRLLKFDATPQLERIESAANSAADEVRKLADRLQHEGSQVLEGLAMEKLLTRLGHALAARDAAPSAPLDAFGRDPAREKALLDALEVIYRRWFRVTTDGIDGIPASGGAILVANHGGVLPWDMAMLKTAVALEHPAHRTVRPLIEDGLMHAAFVGTFLSRAGAVRANPENAETVLREGELVSAFPEGNRGISKPFKDRYKLQRFGRGGVVRLALKTGVPVVPVAILGSEETTPLLFNFHRGARALGLPVLPVTPTFPALGPAGLLPLPAKWHLEFGAPVHFDAAPDADDRTVLRLTEQLRTDLQQRLDRLASKRRGIFR